MVQQLIAHAVQWMPINGPETGATIFVTADAEVLWTCPCPHHAVSHVVAVHLRQHQLELVEVRKTVEVGAGFRPKRMSGNCGRFRSSF